MRIVRIDAYSASTMMVNARLLQSGGSRPDSPPAKIEAGTSTRPVTATNTAESSSRLSVRVPNVGIDHSECVKVLPVIRAIAPAATMATPANAPSHASTVPCRDEGETNDRMMPAPHNAKDKKMNVCGFITTLASLTRFSRGGGERHGRLASDDHEQTVQNRQWRWRISRDFHIHG